MRNLLIAFAITFTLCSGATAGTSPNPGADTVAVCHTPPSHDFTLWVTPAAVPAHLAHGDFIGECPESNVTTTTLNTTTTTTIEEGCPDVPIENDPARLVWRNGLFFIHGSINPAEEDLTEVGGFGVTLATDPDGIFLAAGCLLEPVSGTSWRCTTEDIRVAVRQRMSVERGTYYTFKVKGTPPWTPPTTKDIRTRVSFTCVGGFNDSTWSGTLGQKIWVKY